MKYPWIDTQTGSERVPQARSFESLSWGDSSGFLLTGVRRVVLMSAWMGHRERQMASESVGGRACLLFEILWL